MSMEQVAVDAEAAALHAAHFHVPEGGVLGHVSMFVSLIGPDGEEYVATKTYGDARRSDIIGSVMLALFGDNGVASED